jgi:hypothetical protein
MVLSSLSSFLARPDPNRGLAQLRPGPAGGGRWTAAQHGIWCLLCGVMMYCFFCEGEVRPHETHTLVCVSYCLLKATCVCVCRVCRVCHMCRVFACAHFTCVAVGQLRVSLPVQLHVAARSIRDELRTQVRAGHGTRRDVGRVSCAMCAPCLIREGGGVGRRGSGGEGAREAGLRQREAAVGAPACHRQAEGTLCAHARHVCGDDLHHLQPAEVCRASRVKRTMKSVVAFN